MFQNIRKTLSADDSKSNCFKYIFKGVFLLIIVLFFFTLPFLNNHIDHTIAQLLWYPSCILFIGNIVADCISTDVKSSKIPLYTFLENWGITALVFAFISIFVLRYYEIDNKWLWVIFAFIAIYTPIFFLSLLAFNIKYNKISKEDAQKASLNICKYILLYWLLDLFYMSIFNSWLIPTIIFGVLSDIIIFFNLGTVFFNGDKSTRFLIVLDLLFGLGLSAYLIYIIPNKLLREIILTIVAAVFGGIFTLVGVAWTFKKGDEDRRADLHRIESERKEEERKKLVPYVNISNGFQPAFCAKAYVHKGLDFENKDDRHKCKGNVFHLIQIKDFDIKNISESNIIVAGISIDNKYYPFNKILLERNTTCRIQTTDNWSIAIPESIKSIKLLLCDILQNTYEIECEFDYDPDTRGYEIAETEDGEKFTGFNCLYTITNVSLPKLIQENKENE